MRKSYKLFLADKRLLRSALIGFLLLGGSLVMNFYAGNYANEKGTTAVTDIILSNTRAYDVDILFAIGLPLFALFTLLRCIRYPAQIPYILKSVAVFVIIRSVFITLTHLGPFPDSIAVYNAGILGKMNFGADLFFSGHTGLPFLFALIFWNNKWMRYLFIFSAIFFGMVVLLGHLHYSIDVLAAFFITYTINHINEIIRKKDKRFFQNADSIIYAKHT
ncbi:MAG: phosphatase PAP2-related protein [candidate division SR1 bacterium]|nr:phosphatase PAP2-related protein [candidate division SR1 bacterium]